MTRDDAVTALRNAAWLGTDADRERIEMAVDMAVETLSADGDTISRQAAIDCMMRLQREDEEAYGASIPEGFDGERAAEALRQLPSAQPERTGRWIHDGYDHPHGVDWMHCSNCGRREPYVPAAMTNYCPNCGAKMEVEHEHSD